MSKDKIPCACKSEFSDEVVYDGRKTFENQTWVKNVVFLDGTTTIKDSAFEGCTGLEFVHLPESIVAISNSAFYGCTNIKRFYVPKNVRFIGEKNSCQFFNQFSQLTAIDVHPENKTFSSYKGMLIVDKTLTMCPPNSEITVIDSLPETVTDIASGAFRNCKNLEIVHVPSDIKGDLYFDGCCNLKELTVPAECRSINIKGCRSLEKIEVPPIVCSLNITGCHSLTEIVLASDDYFRVQDGFLISADNKLIGVYNHKTEAIIPEGVVEIRSGALGDCPSLVSVTIPASVESIQKEAFYKSSNLKEIKVADGNTHFVVKDGMLLNSMETVLYFCPGKEGEIVVPTTVKRVSDGAFSTCKNAKIVFSPQFTEMGKLPFEGMENCTLCIPDSCNLVYRSAFDGAKNLTVDIYHCNEGQLYKTYRFGNVKGVKIPEPIENIVCEAFYGCDELTDLQLPKTMKDIGYSAFHGCKSLQTLFLPDAVACVGKYAFVDVKQIELTNVCKVEKAYLDLEAPLCFEGTNGSMYSSESTNKVVVRGLNTEESRQRFEKHLYWFGEVKPALQAVGCSFFYWDMEDNTFAVRVADYDITFNGLNILPTDKVVNLVSVLSKALQNTTFKMKITESLGKAKPAPKKPAKKSLFKTATSEDDNMNKQTMDAKKEKLAFMYEQMILAQMDDYLSANESVQAQLCSSTKTNVVVGINYKYRFCFSTTVANAKVEDGSASEYITSLLKHLDQNDIDFKVL